MIIQKFGGTSVGNAQRMKQVADLVNDGKRKIVVLSAVSGTTNKLVELSQALYRKDSAAVENLLEYLKQHYDVLVNELLKDKKKQEAVKALDTHWTHIKAFTLDMFTPFEERAILAQGELISTMLMQLYMEQEGIKSALIPALDFMRIDQKNEPD
ncbi:MAG: aspartate kinase, partial [Salibacteraceae bacterium]|nr:aspartate kinase [Salibacteraceae bacterium]